MGRRGWALLLGAVAALAAVVAVWAADEVAKTVSAQRLCVTDENGQVLALLQADAQGRPELVVFAEDGSSKGILLSTLVAPDRAQTGTPPPWPQVPTPPGAEQSPPPATPSASSLQAPDPTVGQYWSLKGKKDADPAWVARLEQQHPTWSHGVCVMIGQHRIGIGMTNDQVRESWGNPEGNSTSTSQRGTLEQWRYPSLSKFWSDVSGVAPKVAYLNFENGTLISVQFSE
jgi:hypothetical protein